MRVLLIEDDANKSKHIQRALQQEQPSILIEEARSYQRGIDLVFSRHYDLVLLDMSLPIYEDEETEDSLPETFAGITILNEMKRKGKVVPVIVITQFETLGDGDELVNLNELRLRLRAEFEELYKGLIYYNASESDWHSSLLESVRRLNG
jgi:DNA-binding response OmpR family regulator